MIIVQKKNETQIYPSPEENAHENLIMPSKICLNTNCSSNNTKNGGSRAVRVVTLE